MGKPNCGATKRDAVAAQAGANTPPWFYVLDTSPLQCSFPLSRATLERCGTGYKQATAPLLRSAQAIQGATLAGPSDGDVTPACASRMPLHMEPPPRVTRGDSSSVYYETTSS